jgi:amino acid permease
MKNPYPQKKSKRSTSGEKLFSDTDEDELKRIVPPVKKVLGLFN